MRPPVLTPDELTAAVAGLEGWELVDGALRRDIVAASFLDGIEVVRQIALIAEEMDHHPDIDIRWRTIRVALSTHDPQGITSLDVDQAARISTLV